MATLFDASRAIPAKAGGAVLRVRVFALLAFADIVCISTGIVATAFVRGQVFTDSNWVRLLGMLLPVYLGTAFTWHAYALEHLQNRTSAVFRGVQAMLFAASAVVLVAFLLKTSENFPRLTFTFGVTVALLLIGVSRSIISKHLSTIVGGNPHSVVLIRDRGEAVPAGNYSAVIDSESFSYIEGHDPFMYDRLAHALAGADRVVVACHFDHRQSWAHALKGANIQAEIVVPELAALAPLGIGVHNRSPTLIVSSGPLDWFDRLQKRAFDVVVAIAAILLLSPLLVTVAVLIKADSTGPVFFRQTRIGRSNKMFTMLKFRSMKVDSCDGSGAKSTRRQDDRITAFGRFIRKTSIDELPQLFNVLRGDMSIVGPRPHALGSRAADKLFWEVDDRYWHRHAAKPGLTGLAQVRGYRGATVLEDDLINRLQADLEYLENWTIMRDFIIIFMTFGVLVHKNAY